MDFLPSRDHRDWQIFEGGIDLQPDYWILIVTMFDALASATA